MKKIDWKKEIAFPITIPLKMRYVYRPDRTRSFLKNHDFINFKEMDGNEILINL